MQPLIETLLSIEDLEHRPAIQIAHAGSLMLSKYQMPNPEDLDALLRHQQAVAKQHDGKISVLSLVHLQGNVGKISDEIRKKTVEVIKELSPICIGSATVILGTGLSSTMARMFLTGFYLVSKPPFPQKAFSSVAEALAWVQQLPGQTSDPRRLNSSMIIKHFGLTGVR